MHLRRKGKMCVYNKIKLGKTEDVLNIIDKTDDKPDRKEQRGMSGKLMGRGRQFLLGDKCA